MREPNGSCSCDRLSIDERDHAADARGQIGEATDFDAALAFTGVQSGEQTSKQVRVR